MKWEIGKRIVDFKEGLRSNKVLTDETPTVHRLLKILAKKLNCSVSSFYQAFHFAREYPEWNDFANANFELRKKVGYHYNTVTKSGAQLTWHQVLYKVLFPRDKAKRALFERYTDIDDPSIHEDCGLYPNGNGHRCDGELITVRLCEAHFLLDWTNWRLESKGKEERQARPPVTTLEDVLEGGVAEKP